jgi:transcriptional regulator with XRE-family HTH domain
MAKISERIRTLRKSEHLSQEQFGNLFGIAKTTVSSYERNNSVPDDELKIKICKHFKVSLDYLIGITDIKQSFSTHFYASFTQPMSEKENQVLVAYRSHPEMQSAVDKLLGIDFPSAGNIAADVAEEAKDFITSQQITSTKQG